MSAAAQRLAHTHTGTPTPGQPVLGVNPAVGVVKELWAAAPETPTAAWRTHDAAFQSGRQQRPPPARRRLALAALTVANASNFWQRNLIYALASVIPPQCLKECENAAFVPVCDVCDEDECEECQTCRAGADAAYYSIRDAACVSDRQYGLLASVAFTTCFALSGLAAGHLADRLDAKRLHAGAALTWALAGFLPVIYPSFSMLVLARFITGVAEGFNAPCAYPVTAYHYAVHERASANGCYSMGTYAGSALSTLSLLFAMGVGWRQTTTMACVVGIFAAALLWLVVDRPPRRTIPSDSLYVSLRRAVLYVLRVKRLLGLYGATSVRMAATVSLWTYLPTYYSRAFPEDAVAFSLSYALGTLLCGAASSSGGGYIADAWAVRRKGAHGDVAAIGAVLAVPLAYGCLYAATFGGSLTCLLLLILVSECWLGPGMSLLVEDVPTKSMGTQVALLLSLQPGRRRLGTLGRVDARPRRCEGPGPAVPLRLYLSGHVGGGLFAGRTGPRYRGRGPGAA